MVPCVPMIIMLYTTTAIISGQEKYLNKKRKKKGSIPASIKKLTKEIQFLRVLKTLIREKASDHSCFFVGMISEPWESFQP